MFSLGFWNILWWNMRHKLLEQRYFGYFKEGKINHNIFLALDNSIFIDWWYLFLGDACSKIIIPEKTNKNRKNDLWNQYQSV